ncbi:MAG: hypothetical protein K1Y01_05295, partial [Vicinamibacteria bacterium]|nr:hypothetical protein [Vicinamibacteria bacterium]
MSTSTKPDIEPLLAIPGAAADHLYREGSAKASFWEAVFGSSLSAKRRTRVSALEDGTRRFDIPVDEVEGRLLADAQAFFNAPERAASCLEAANAIASKGVRLALVGLQPRGQAVARFSLRFEPTKDPSPAAAASFRAWFE